MTKRILVPTDFSAQANAALTTAVNMAQAFKGELYVLHSIDMYDGVVPRASLDSPINREELKTKKAIAIIEENLKAHNLGNINPKIIIGKETILQDIINYSELHQIDFIVMGSSGSSGLEEMLIGSNTERVVRHSKIPVIVIKDKPLALNLKDSFVFASSLKNKDKPALDKAKKVAQLLGTKLEVLYINTQTNFKTTKDIYTMISNFLNEEERLKIKVIVHNGESIEEGIIDYMNQRNTSLYGIGTNGRKGLARLFNDSITERLVNHAPNSIICFAIN